MVLTDGLQHVFHAREFSMACGLDGVNVGGQLVRIRASAPPTANPAALGGLL